MRLELWQTVRNTSTQRELAERFDKAVARNLNRRLPTIHEPRNLSGIMKSRCFFSIGNG
jgi:hypothetical protein